MKILLFPEGYDPQIASGSCPDSLKRINITWTPEDTNKHKELEKQAIIVKVENPPQNRWFEKIDDLPLDTH